MAIVAAFRSWSGIINLCKAGNSGIQSLIGLLCIPNMEVRKGLLEVLYEIFRLPVPIVTQDFIEALLSVDPSRFQDSWRLSDGFVAAEAKVILPHRARSRPDLMDNYLGFVLSSFINSGLLEGLVEVVTSSDDQLAVRATILLGELLHMANTILPHSHSHHLHCLPTLMNLAASFDIPQEKRLRASAAVNNLKRFHEKKKKGLKPHSLYLDHWPNVNLRNNKDEQMHRFVRRLLYFYKPSSKLYAGLALDHAKARQLTVVGCQFMEFLMDSDEDGQGYLEDLVRDMVSWLSLSSGLKPERSLQSNGLVVTLSQHYFLFLGTLSAHPQGVKLLEKCGLFQCLLSLCFVKNQDAVLKLAVTTLDYSRDGLARVILSKILTAATDTCRLYATKHLRVLLRAGVDFFSSWGMELLVTQLHDHSKAVSMEALDILDEACEDKANLHALIQLKPALSHLGDKGLLLLLRFLSIPKGFSYLNERGYVSKQLDKWQKEYNLKYVDLIEEQLNEALTTYRKPVDGDNYVRRSNQRLQRPNVYLPVHLYGQLVHDKTGCHLLEAQSVVPDLSYTVRSPMLDTWEGIKQLKASLWALANIGSSNWGLNLLQEENVIPDIITLAQHCEVLSVRGTSVYVLGVISKTRQGCEVLKQYGWDAVRHSRRTLWPVTPDEVDAQLTSELSSVPSTLSLNSESTGSRHNSESESQPNMYIMDDDKCDVLDQSDESSFYLHPKPVKDRSPFTILASTRFVRTRFLNSLSLPSKKLRSTSDPKTLFGSRTPTDFKTGSMRRNRTVTEPSIYSATQGDVFTPIFNGRGMPKSPTVSVETSFVGNRGNSEEHLVDGRLVRGGGSGFALSVLAGQGPVEHPGREKERGGRPPVPGHPCLCAGDRPSVPVLKQQFSITELIACRGEGQNHMVGSEETGLQEHCEENCLYCVGASVLGYPTQPQLNSTHPRTDYVDFPSWGGQSGHRLEVMPQSKFSGVSGCSDSAVSQGSICSTPTPADIVINGKAISEDGPASRVLLRKEVLRLIINLSSSVGTKGHETGLLTIKEKFSYAFDDICLYSEVSHLLAHCMFRLTSRRFIQELFQDVQFMPMYEEAEAILTKPPKHVQEDADPVTES
ncbi:rapamycin-insensitive companion of mTOR-like [Cynoglossus semilaevis]|uniref:rapamycin-insensitive companion of mTOR-like n=1 Tax=Cynoglossus semilaevis TaxID=244447 RepID=UPI000D6270FE|nr:rapamycin-insensitive companion of mTOR-like [Cynoglossus semilaevis]